MNKVLEYIIRAKDATGNAVSSALSKLKGLASGIGRNLMNIKAGFDMLAGAVRFAMDKMQKAFAFETMTMQFKRLIGSMDEARDHMAMLQKMGDTPPFSLEQFAAASRSLMVMSDGALGFQKSLELVGDAAAATGQPIENLAHELGRAYAIIRDGQPLTRATMGLRNMGAITPEVASKLDEMQKAGASNLEIWNELTGAIGKFHGAMADTEETGEGLMGAISSQWDDIVREFGAAFLDVSKGGMKSILERLKELREDGSIDLFAEKARQAVEKIIAVVKDLSSAVKQVWNATVFAFKAVGGELGRFAGALSMGNFKDAFTGIGKETARAYEEVYDPDGTQARKDEEYKARAAAKRREKAAEEAKKEAESKAKEEERVQKQMSDARKKQEEKAAKERADFKKSLEAEIAKAEMDVEEKAHMAEMNHNDESAQRRLEQAEEYLAKLKEVTTKAEKAELDSANSLTNARIDMEERIANERKRLMAEHVREVGEQMMEELDEKEKEIKKRIEKAKKGIERTRKGQATDARVTNGIFGAYEYGGRSNGGENFTDWQRAQRYAERADRDAKKAERRDAAQERRAERIKADMEAGRKVSDADKRFLDKFNDFQEQKNDAKNAQDALEALQKERDKVQKDIQKTLKKIEKNIGDALEIS